ncbi:SMP-30/gluconolactonase/LRE family protein [Porticoccus sp. W117]|uniref:SMP-30/gluconolactonase/LRE family protein n=1 Tax=Porticoccus sp. W117 TaxID=3054777 RepID=UPI00259A3045|nr:SMP-30/gluconolactonase/LRE family protein [Porticoccus sp. W117]MDM3870059.1 SMP-30/gluconolactonase/LRE family protein [Porticoccus sp. W117]
MSAELIHSIPVHNTLGEGVVWDARSQAAWWTDIQESRLFCMAYPSLDIEYFDTPERLCCFALTDNPDKLLVAFASGFALYEYRTGNLQWLHRPEELQPGSGRRLNDGRLDRQGRFWVGAMVEDKGAATGKPANLYCLDSNGELSIHKSDIAISNGICWAPDNSTFYFADSPKQHIYSYKYDISRGSISEQKQFSATPVGQFPDGGITDSNGHVWSAHWGGHCVVRYTPQGQITEKVAIPTQQPSCLAFGGADMKTLFVTSARQGLNSQQLAKDTQAGNLFVLETTITGLQEPIYQT